MGVVTNWSGNPVLLDSTVPQDQRIFDIVRKMKVLVDQRGNVRQMNNANLILCFAYIFVTKALNSVFFVGEDRPNKTEA